MTDQQYRQIDLVELYDDLNPLGADSDYFLAACAPATHTVLDIGCGTGLLTKALAARGHLVVGVDPAEAMLDIARRHPMGKAGAPNIQWICADAAGLDLLRQFDRVVASGHVFQVFQAERDQQAFLRAAARHLTPDGKLIFDTRNPVAQPWLSWTPERSHRHIEHPHFGPIDIWHQVTAVGADRVSFVSTYHFLRQNQYLTSDSILAFPTCESVLERLREAGLEVVTVHGDWDGTDFTVAASEIIVTARLNRADL